MKLNFRRFSVLVLLATVTFTSCKKDDKDPDPTPDKSSEIAVHADDQNRISTEMDNVANEAVTALESPRVILFQVPLTL